MASVAVMERVCLLLLLVVGIIQAQQYTRTASYEDELLARCSGVQRERLQDLLELDGLDVWSISPDGTADIRMKKELYKELKVVYPECSILHSSVEAVVREAERQMRPKNLTADWFEEYHPYEEIIEWYKELATKYPGLVKYVESIGKSYEGRDQPAVHITAISDPDASRKFFYFQCQIHAREWISGTTCMYIANHLAENYGKDDRITALLDKVEIIFVPFMNPDGFEYSWTTDRLWRKNRRPGNSCYGVDINRNYNIQWGGGGSSPNQCSETYHGTGANSEPETQNTVNYFQSYTPIIGSIDWHSYSQLILRPYGWTTTDSTDEAAMKAIGDEMSDEIFKVHGKRYTSQKKYQLYATSGTSSDWFYSDDANSKNRGTRSAGIVIELRDTGQYGFLLPPDQIVPTGQEMIPAVLVFAERLYEKPFTCPLFVCASQQQSTS